MPYQAVQSRASIQARVSELPEFVAPVAKFPVTRSKPANFSSQFAISPAKPDFARRRRELSEGRRFTPYRPEIARLIGNINATILLQQIMFWWDWNGGKPFYKFRAPGAKHPLCIQGDSWLEELAFSPDEFDGALGRIATRISTGSSKRAVLETTELELDARGRITNGKNLVMYWTKEHVTYYELNEVLFDALLAQVYGGATHAHSVSPGLKANPKNSVVNRKQPNRPYSCIQEQEQACGEVRINWEKPDWEKSKRTRANSGFSNQVRVGRENSVYQFGKAQSVNREKPNRIESERTYSDINQKRHANGISYTPLAPVNDKVNSSSNLEAVLDGKLPNLNSELDKSRVAEILAHASRLFRGIKSGSVTTCQTRPNPSYSELGTTIFSQPIGLTNSG